MSTWEGSSYQARFDALAAGGRDVHGEAHFILELAPTSVLDAGCGTGRVAIELARHGVDVVGVDTDASMLATARSLAPTLEWIEADLTSLDLGRTFDVVAMAGNVPLFTAPDTNVSLVAACARHIAEGGALVSGFQLGSGLGREYPLSDYDADCAAAGLVLTERWATWDKGAFTDSSEYAVSVHRRS
jgi:SAM-dependent methyltransferase